MESKNFKLDDCVVKPNFRVPRVLCGSLVCCGLLFLMACSVSGNRLTGAASADSNASTAEMSAYEGQIGKLLAYPPVKSLPVAAGRGVAADMVSAFVELVFSTSDALLPADPLQRKGETRLTVLRPQTGFDYQLIEALQLAGFEIYLASSPASKKFLSVKIKPVLTEDAGDLSSVSRRNHPINEVRSLASEKNHSYEVSIAFSDWTLIRQYSLAESGVRALSPLWLTDKRSTALRVLRYDLYHPAT